MEIPKPKAKKTVNLDPNPNSYPSKLPYPERMKVREHDKPSAQHSRFLKMFKQLRLEIGIKDALVEMPTLTNDRENFYIPCALARTQRIVLLAGFRELALIFYLILSTRNFELEAFAPTDDFELANRSITHPMGIAEDVVVRVECYRKVSSNLEEGYFDSEGDIAFLDNLLSDDDSHNLDSKVTSDHEPEQNESSITFSPRSDPLHHEFAGEPLTLPARNDLIESLPMSPILVEDSEPTQEEIDILLVPDNLIPAWCCDANSR
ncbi:hypothetical protein Tco_1110846 [Tanacetum coccineum]|uniref:Uncharacterized protein n=1 Tax=Tanacetum coccineum TaxID=301880 RepID=A0ABQ5IMF2_9ASTR